MTQGTSAGRAQDRKGKEGSGGPNDFGTVPKCIKPNQTRPDVPNQTDRETTLCGIITRPGWGLGSCLAGLHHRRPPKSKC